jgi:hypothetical protein
MQTFPFSSCPPQPTTSRHAGEHVLLQCGAVGQAIMVGRNHDRAYTCPYAVGNSATAWRLCIYSVSSAFVQVATPPGPPPLFISPIYALLHSTLTAAALPSPRSLEGRPRVTVLTPSQLALTTTPPTLSFPDHNTTSCTILPPIVSFLPPSQS